MEELIETIQGWLSIVGPNPYAQSGAIILAFIVAAKLADWILCGMVLKWARRTKTDFDDRLVELMHRPIFLSVVIVGLVVATKTLELQEIADWVTLAMLKTIATIVWLVFGIRFASLTLEALSRSKERFRLVQPSTLPLLDAVARTVFAGGAVYFIFLAWNIDVTAWMASAGIIGIALSFAAKDSLANFFAGVFILADAPYKIDDFVILDSGERGSVTRIGMRSTRLLTRDDVEIIIPNSVMGNSKIINESGGPYEKQRIRIQAGVAYGSDIDKVREVLLQIASQHPEICKDPEPRVRFRAFGDSGLNFELLIWIEQPALRGQMQDALNSEIYKAFGKEGIEIPYPKRDLYIHKMPERS